ncbi:MAG: amidohydrolase family protein [Gammaproteobacteria bacterium]
MNHRFISCDDHADLQYLPHDLWTERLPQHLVERGPRVEQRDGAHVWVCDGAVLGRWAGAGDRREGPKPTYWAFDRAGVSDEGRRPVNPKLRLADMDRDGVEAQVIFGPVTSLDIEDPELSEACHRAYNEWKAEFCSMAPDRLIGVAMLPPKDPEAATHEVYRLAEQGTLKQANLQIVNVAPRIHDPAWEPLWRAFEDTGIIMSWHVFVFFPVPGESPEAGEAASVFTTTKWFVSQFLDPFVDLFAWGILERHPKLRLVMAESGAGWLPWVVDELDHRHWRLWEAEEFWQDKGIELYRTRPSELFKRQVYVTFQEDHAAMRLLEFFGEDKLLWASDYPHPDSVWPNSHGTVAKQMAGLTEEQRFKITYGNAAALYGLRHQQADSAILA